MNKLLLVSVLLSVVLAGCNDKRTSAQQTFDKDVLALSATVWAAGDMTRKSVEAANVAEQKLNAYKGQKLEKWSCTKTGMSCTTSDKKLSYNINLFPDKFISINAYEGDTLTFNGAVSRIDTGIGSATVWVTVNSEADVVVAKK